MRKLKKIYKTSWGVPVMLDFNTLEMFEVTDDYSVQPDARLMLEGLDLDFSEMVPCAYRIALTEHCNLRCVDCFVTKNLATHLVMTPEILEDVIARTITNSKNLTTPVNYQFFGGEPLLKFDLIKRAVELLDAAAFRNEILQPTYSLTTNAMLVNDEIIDFFKQHNFSVGVSVDGDKDTHNKLRPDSQFNDTFSVVRQKYFAMVDAGINIHVLITPNPAYADQLVSLAKYILDEFPMKTFTVNEAFEYDTLRWTMGSKEHVEALIEITRYAKEKGIETDTVLTPILAAISNETRRRSACSILGKEFLCSVSPDGRFSFCAQKWVKDFDLNKSQKYLLPEQCKECYALGYCGGPCPAFRALTGCEVDENRCAFMRAAPAKIIENLDIFLDDEEG